MVWGSNVALLMVKRMDKLSRLHLAQENNGLRLQHNTDHGKADVTLITIEFSLKKNYGLIPQHNTAHGQMNRTSIVSCISSN